MHPCAYGVAVRGFEDTRADGKIDKAQVAGVTNDVILTESTSGVCMDYYWSFYVDIRSNNTTPRRVALARIFKEAGIRSPRTQLTKVQIEISVQGRRRS